MKDYLLIGFILLMFVLYVVILPLTRRQKLKQQQAQMTDFQQSLKVNDRVMLAAGIFGTVKTINKETVELEVAVKTIIEVDRLAIVGRMTET